jgi:hypothetical protein
MKENKPMKTYPISDIRSGKVAVKLESLEQFKKIAPEQHLNEDINGCDFKKDLYHSYRYHNRLTWFSNEFINHKDCKETLIDFSQIDWEEKKVSDILTLDEQRSEGFKVGYKEGFDHSKDIIASLKSENEMFKAENEILKECNDSFVDNFNKNNPPQELTLKQRMAWEYLMKYKDITTSESYCLAERFLNYNGGENE